MPKLFTGTGVAIVTPFQTDHTIDFISLEKIVEHIIQGKVDFIVALGTTGESSSLSFKEKLHFVEKLKEIVNQRIRIVVGMGGNNTSELIENIQQFNFEGIHGLLSVTPYYNKPQQRGMLEHFSKVADHSPVPVILYNVPSRTSINLNSETVFELAEHPNICGIKEASDKSCQITEILQHAPDTFSVLSGDDALTLQYLALGADGVISVTANAFPSHFSEMVRFALQNDFVQSRKLHFQLVDIMNALFDDGSPAGIKAVLEIMQLSTNNLRLPLMKANDTVYRKLQSLIQKIAHEN